MGEAVTTCSEHAGVCGAATSVAQPLPILAGQVPTTCEHAHRHSNARPQSWWSMTGNWDGGRCAAWGPNTDLQTGQMSNHALHAGLLPIWLRRWLLRCLPRINIVVADKDDKDGFRCGLTTRSIIRNVPCHHIFLACSPYMRMPPTPACNANNCPPAIDYCAPTNSPHHTLPPHEHACLQRHPVK